MTASSRPSGVPDHYHRVELLGDPSRRVLSVGITVTVLSYLVIVHLMIERFAYQRWVVLLIGLIPLTVIVHELLHAVPAWLAGLHVRGGIEHRTVFSLTPYVIPYGGAIPRSQAVLITGLPVVGISLGAISGMIVGTGWIDTAAWIVLFYNALGSAVRPESDLQQVAFLARQPASTLIHTTREGKQVLYRPPTVE